MKLKAGIDTVICTNPPEQKTKSGLTLAKEEKKPELGIVYAVGKVGKESEMPLEMKIGDIIVFRRYADNRIFIEGKEYNFINFKDVVGVLDNENA